MFSHSPLFLFRVYSFCSNSVTQSFSFILPSIRSVFLPLRSSFLSFPIHPQSSLSLSPLILSLTSLSVHSPAIHLLLVRHSVLLSFLRFLRSLFLPLPSNLFPSLLLLLQSCLLGAGGPPRLPAGPPVRWPRLVSPTGAPTAVTLLKIFTTASSGYFLCGSTRGPADGGTLVVVPHTGRHARSDLARCTRSDLP